MTAVSDDPMNVHQITTRTLSASRDHAVSDRGLREPADETGNVVAELDLTELVARLRRQTSSILTLEAGSVVRRSHAQLHDDVIAAYETLRSWGVKAGSRVGIRLANCYNWIVYDLALIKVGAVSVAFTEDFAKSSPQELADRYNLSLLLLSVRERTAETDNLPTIAYVDGPKSQIRARNDNDAEPADHLDHPWMIFSSGSAGGVKGLRLNRKGVEKNIDRLVRHAGVRHDDRLILFLPMSNFQQRAMYYAALWFGFDLIVTEPARLFYALKELKPTILIAPPALYELFELRVINATPFARWLGPIVGRGINMIPGARTRDAVAKRIFRNVYNALGGNMRIMLTGMAPIRRSTLSLFASMRLPLLEVYGLTEAGNVAANLPGANRLGSVGKPIPGVHVRLAEDKEILVHSLPAFADEYFECSAGENERTFIGNGWIATGDVGRFDADGYLYIVGRKKEIIVTSGGKKVHPEMIEAEIDGCGDVAKSVVFGGPGAPFLIAVVEMRDANDAAARSRVAAHVDACNKGRTAYEVAKVIYSDVAFTRENNFLRPNLKLDRRRIAAHFGSALQELDLNL